MFINKLSVHFNKLQNICIIKLYEYFIKVIT